MKRGQNNRCTKSIDSLRSYMPLFHDILNTNACLSSKSSMVSSRIVAYIPPYNSWLESITAGKIDTNFT